MKTIKRLALSAGVAGIIIGGGAVAANAGTSYVDYVAVMPKFQQSTYMPWQTKAYTNTNSELIIRSIGGGYKVNAKTDVLYGNQGPEIKNLGVGGPYGLAFSGGYASGSVRLVLTNSAWTTVDVATASPGAATDPSFQTAACRAE